MMEWLAQSHIIVKILVGSFLGILLANLMGIILRKVLDL